MKTPKYEESAASKREARRARADNINAIQQDTIMRTSLMDRMRSPRISIATGVRSGVSMVR